MRNQVRAAIAVWAACATPLWAHPPYVEPYKKISAFAVAATLGILTTVLLRKPHSLWIRVLIGIAVWLLCWLLGFFMSIAFSM
jgi:hypothetical protein